MTTQSNLKQKRSQRNAGAEKVWQALVGLLLLAALIFAFNYGLKKQEKIDCYKWQNYEANYSLFETSPETIEHCLSLGVYIEN